MALVKRENVELTIAEELVDEYLEMGYSLLNEKGEVIRKKLTDADKVRQLESENLTLKETIKKLTGEINALKASHINSNEVSEATPTNSPPKKKASNKGD